MAVREIVEIGHPALRTRAREVEPAEIGSAEIEALIDDLIETKRAADGAGIAANQVGVPLRVAIAERPSSANNDDHRVSVTASFGIAAMPGDGTTQVELVAAADEALYRAKRAGKNRIAIAAATEPQP